MILGTLFEYLLLFKLNLFYPIITDVFTAPLFKINLHK